MAEIEQLLQIGVAHHNAGRLAEAESAYRQVLTRQPNHPGALHLLGVLAQQAGRSDLAVDLIARAISLQPNVAAYHLNHGVALAGLDRLDESIAAQQRAIALKNDFPEAWGNLADALLRKGSCQSAIDAARRALEIRPDYPEAANNLGNALLADGKIDAAIESFSRAIAGRADFALAHFNLANAFRARGDSLAAIEEYRRAIALRSDFAEAYNNLGRALIDGGKFEEAMDCYRRAVAVRPGFAQAHNNLGNTLKMTGFLDLACASYETAMRLDPANPAIRSSFIYMLFCSPRFDAARIFEEQKSWNARFAVPLADRIRPHDNDPSPDRKLRIGYVSADLRDHVAGLNLLPLLREHDKEKFQIICYANMERPDAVTEKYRAAVDDWRDIHRLGDEQVAELIRRDGIDILMDLSLHSEGGRLLVFARKPAPVQGTFIGYPGSTGLATIDFRLTDSYLDPPGESNQFYSEESIRLPDCFWCFDPDSMRAPSDPVSPLPVAANSYITFGALNNICKVTDEVLSVWADVLRRVPDSRLVMLVPTGAARRRVIEKLALEQINPDRIEFIDRVFRSEYLKIYERIDLGLDAFPCNGHATTLDSLWMSVPLVTMTGNTVAGRAGWSQLNNLGLPELAAFTPQQFVNLAVELANDRPRLADVRQPSPADGGLAIVRCPAICAQRGIGVSPTVAKMVRETYSVAMTSGSPTASLEQAFTRAVSLHQAGLLREAEVLYRQVLAGQPEHSNAIHLLGVIALQIGQYEQALDYISHAIALAPGIAEYHSNFGLALLGSGRLHESLAACRKAISIRPDMPEAYNHRGSALFALGESESAIAAYRKAVELRPDYVEALDNLGCALMVDEQTEEAIATHRRAIALKPKNPKAHNNLGLALARLPKYDESLSHFDAAMSFSAPSAEIYNNLGNTLLDAGCGEQSVAAYDQGLALSPDDRTSNTNRLFALHFLPDYPRENIFQEHLAWNARFAAELGRNIVPHGNKPDPDRRLRIGYVSPDFREHSVAHFLQGLLAHHDHENFEIFAYADLHRPDALSAEFQSQADHWRNVTGLADQQVAEIIRKDQIDILIDLAGLTSSNRLLVFARKPAPVQITYLGYPDTTGLGVMDYRLTDIHADPPGMTEALHSEKLLRLPESFLCFSPPKDAPDPSPLPAKKNRHITFGCFNVLAKINGPLISWWCRILQGVPDSRMILKTKGLSDASARKRLLDQFKAGGIEAERIDLLSWTPSRREHLELYGKIDLALDTFPYTGTTISCEALWMGVPIVTLAGNTHARRVGASLLTNVGLQKLIANTPDEYVDLAIKQAKDRASLSKRRTAMRKKMTASVLTDGKVFAEQIESAYREVWKNWCEGRR